MLPFQACQKNCPKQFRILLAMFMFFAAQISFFSVATIEENECNHRVEVLAKPRTIESRVAKVRKVFSIKKSFRELFTFLQLRLRLLISNRPFDIEAFTATYFSPNNPDIFRSLPILV